MFKKFLYKAVVLSGCMIMLGVSTNAGATPIATSAEVVGNITVTQNTALNFGQLTVGAAGGTLRFDAGGAVAVTGDVVSLGGEIGGVADLNTTGVAPAGSLVTVTVTGTTLVNGAFSMPIAGNCKEALNALGADNGSCTFNSSELAAEPVAIGGVITVGANQATGVYSGSLEVTAAF
jgi:hypothetical protein